MEYELKPLSAGAIEAALAKAEHYRLLNEPWQAESICRDVLEAAADNQRAVVLLILSLTDQFASSGGAGFDEARTLTERLDSAYAKAYYGGIICERRAKVHFDRGTPGCGHVAYEWYERAMAKYEEAESLAPENNQEARLRWNTCARAVMRHPSIEPAPAGERQPMLE